MIELTTAERRGFDRLCTPQDGLFIVAANRRAEMKATMLETAVEAGSVSTLNSLRQRQILRWCSAAVLPRSCLTQRLRCRLSLTTVFFPQRPDFSSGWMPPRT